MENNQNLSPSVALQGVRIQLSNNELSLSKTEDAVLSLTLTDKAARSIRGALRLLKPAGLSLSENDPLASSNVTVELEGNRLKMRKLDVAFYLETSEFTTKNTEECIPLKEQLQSLEPKKQTTFQQNSFEEYSFHRSMGATVAAIGDLYRARKKYLQLLDEGLVRAEQGGASKQTLSTLRKEISPTDLEIAITSMTDFLVGLLSVMGAEKKQMVTGFYLRPLTPDVPEDGLFESRRRENLRGGPELLEKITTTEREDLSKEAVFKTDVMVDQYLKEAMEALLQKDSTLNPEQDRLAVKALGAVLEADMTPLIATQWKVIHHIGLKKDFTLREAIDNPQHFDVSVDTAEELIDPGRYYDGRDYDWAIDDPDLPLKEQARQAQDNIVNEELYYLEDTVEKSMKRMRAGQDSAVEKPYIEGSGATYERAVEEKTLHRTEIMIRIAKAICAEKPEQTLDELIENATEKTKKIEELLKSAVKVLRLDNHNPFIKSNKKLIKVFKYQADCLRLLKKEQKLENS